MYSNQDKGNIGGLMDKNAFKFMACSLALATLTACGGGSSSNPPPPIANGVTKAFATNAIPKLNSDPGLAIMDTDNNGVRDDVDTLIKAKYTVPTDISAATQYAWAAQMGVAASSPASSDMPVIFTALTAAVDCAVAQMGAASADAMIADVRAATTNTKERFMAYRETEAAMSGQHAVITDADPKTFCK
jgi:hypothetical protein